MNTEKTAKKILVDPMPLKKNSTAIISYNGQLASSANSKVYIHYGYGANMEWKNVNQQEMTPSPKGFTTSIIVKGDDRLNLCFHDNSGHWDNNHGSNWSYEIQ